MKFPKIKFEDTTLKIPQVKFNHKKKVDSFDVLVFTMFLILVIVVNTMAFAIGGWWWLAILVGIGLLYGVSYLFMKTEWSFD
jgi:hypothetical protein